MATTAHRQKRRRKRRATKQAGWPLFWSLVRDAVPYLLAIYGFCALLGVAVDTPSDVRALQDDTRLRDTGTVVTATVTSVEKEHHDAKRSHYDAYAPTVTVPVGGVNTAVELSKYRSIDDPTAFVKGQRLQMLVAPPITDEHDVAIKDEAARHRFEAALRHDVVLAATGGPAFGVGGTLFAMQLITSKRKKAKRA